MAFALGASAGMIIFHRDGIGLTMKEIGMAGMWISGAGMVLAYPAGWAVDRWHPIRITLLVTVPLTLAQFIAFFFMRDLPTYVLFQGGTLVFMTLFTAAGMPMLIKIFPKDKFGQFCSCNGMVRSTARMIGGVFAAVFIDYMTNFSADKFAFRWVYVWIGVFQVAGLVSLWLMYVKWKSMGGDDSYVPPGSALEKEMIAKGQRRPDEQGETAPVPA
jgi:MFS family permease